MSKLAFKLDLGRPAEHEFRVALEFDALELTEMGLAGVGRAENQRQGGSLELFLPVWTPGSYLLREYSRHVSRFSAHDRATGAALETTKTRKNRWSIDLPPHVRGVRATWSVYAHELTVRTADLTEHHAFWNGACLFLWPVAATSGKPLDLAATIDVSLPRGWELATQLSSEALASGALRLHARGLDELVDTPCLAGTLRTLRFEAAGKPHSFVLEGLEGIEPPATLVPDTRRIIEEAAKLFGGELPYDHYSFLSLFSDQGRGGLEHLTSSVLLAPRTTWAPRKSYEDFLSLVAHEHFHLWNVKRIVPAPLGAFDYENENYTTLLWVAEGFTSYYDDHLCLRAGIFSKDRYLEILAEGIADLRSVPGRREHPLAMASYDTWIKFYRPDEHTKNSTQSYYSSGALAALYLDLTVRASTRGNRSLDDVMRELWQRARLEGGTYTSADVVACLSEVSGIDMKGLVAELIDEPFDPHFDKLLAQFGIRIVRKEDRSAYFGITFKSDELVVQSVVVGDPAHEAGLAPGDEILALAGIRVKPSSWKNVLENLDCVGKPLEALIARRGKILVKSLTPRSTPATLKLELVPDPTEEQKLLRQSWLS